nr:unnamed protein product [Digitaria exilis]
MRKFDVRISSNPSSSCHLFTRRMVVRSVVLFLDLAAVVR